MILIAVAVLFLVVIFFIKTRTEYKKQAATDETGLSYSSNTTLGDLVNKDTDGDGISDWEEGLWGTDPTKKETTPGTPDSVAIEGLKSKQNNQATATSQVPENLTQTDQFSRDLFATIAAATQNGQPMDQATESQISTSLENHIENSPPRKVYTLVNINISNDTSLQSIQKYNIALGLIFQDYKGTTKVTDILKEFIADQNNPNVEALSKLAPISAQMNQIISAMVKMNVPVLLAQPHLNLINALERVGENISDVQLYDTDVIVAFTGISQYNDNNTALTAALDNLQNAINNKLKN